MPGGPSDATPCWDAARERRFAGATAGSCGRVEAAFAFTFREQGADVVAIGSGSIDLAGFSRTGEEVLLASGVSAQNAVAGVAGIVAVYHAIMGPGSFGVSGPVVASDGGGDAVAVNGSDGFLGVALAYVSGSALSRSMEFAGQTFAAMGVTRGTHAWTWGAGANADSFKVQIGAAAVPESASVLAIGAGLPGLAAVRHRRGSAP